MEEGDRRRGFTMDQANILVTRVSPLENPKLEVEMTNGKRYLADLKIFKKVKCFPKTQEEWKKVFITEGGYNITWSSRFEVHAGQIIAHAVSEDVIKKQA